MSKSSFHDRYCELCEEEAITIVDSGWIYGWCSECEEMWTLRKRKPKNPSKRSIIKYPWRKWRTTRDIDGCEEWL